VACASLDGQVAVPSDDELKGLLEKFVCVRIVQMWGTDLSRFEFDGSLTWAVFFTHADGTIYGRYGSRSARGKHSDREISLAGFKKSLRGAIALHRRYVEDKAGVGKELHGKTTQSKPVWPTPEEIPTLKSNARLNRPFLGQRGRHGGCIHCHMVATNELKSLRAAGKPIPDRKFFPYPLPDLLGFHMDPEEMATVQRVHPDSLASKAGLAKGDRILRAQGQPILSTADIQWVLHNAGDKDTLGIEVSRDQQEKTLKLELPEGWRERMSDWRFINMGLLRQTLGFNVTEMGRQAAQRLGLNGKLALSVDRTDRDLRRQTGLGNRDLIVAIDGKREPMTVGAFCAYVFRHKPSASKIKVTILEIVDRYPRPEHEIEVTVR
jgi:serine protease Do